jgi:hypothetical protein
VERALAHLAVLRDELAGAADCAPAGVCEDYRMLAPKLEHLERFFDASEDHVAELRELLRLALELKDRIQHC